MLCILTTGHFCIVLKWCLAFMIVLVKCLIFINCMFSFVQYITLFLYGFCIFCLDLYPENYSVSRGSPRITHPWTLTDITKQLNYLVDTYRGLSRKCPAIVNIMRTVCVISMWPGSQGECIRMLMCEQWWLHCTSQWGQ